MRELYGCFFINWGSFSWVSLYSEIYYVSPVGVYIYPELSRASERDTCSTTKKPVAQEHTAEGSVLGPPISENSHLVFWASAKEA